MAAQKSSKYPYRWPGQGFHSIPLATHRAHVKALSGASAAPAAPPRTPGSSRPIVPGSSITEGQLGAQARANVAPTYRPLIASNKQAIAQARNAARDIGGPGGFYDQYLKSLAQHQQNVNAIATQANTAAQSLAGAVTGLGTSEQASLAGAAGAQAMPGQTAADQSKTASDALAVRQALTASFGDQQVAQNAAAQTYADTLANVVGPGEKVTAQKVAQAGITTARQNLQTTREKRQADILAFKQQARSEEQKNVTALQAAGLSEASKAADRTQRQKQWQNTPNQWGVPNGTWLRMSMSDRLAWKKQFTQAGQKQTTPWSQQGDHYGKSNGEWFNMTPDQQLAWIRKVKVAGTVPKPGDTGTQGLPPGVKPASQGRIQTSQGTLQAAQSTIRVLVKNSPNLRVSPNMSKAERDRRRARLGAALIAGQGPSSTVKKGDENKPKSQQTMIKHPGFPALRGIMVTAALDQYYLDGKISRATAHRLALLGYTPAMFGFTVLSQQDVDALNRAGQQPTFNPGGGLHDRTQFP